jgi:hypothetical protein
MAYDQQLIAAKLRRWEKYLLKFRLPEWQEIPDIGLYMEQVVAVLKQYLDYLPPELKEEQIITSATINNYVRTHIMPEPRKKRYYRVHIAYLIIICTLKQSLSIAMVQRMIPTGLDEEQVREFYQSYRDRHCKACELFVQQVRLAAAIILDHPVESATVAADTRELIVSSAIIAGFSKLFAEKLLLLDDKTLANGGSIEIEP